MTKTSMTRSRRARHHRPRRLGSRTGACRIAMARPFGAGGADARRARAARTVSAGRRMGDALAVSCGSERWPNLAPTCEQPRQRD